MTQDRSKKPRNSEIVRWGSIVCVPIMIAVVGYSRISQEQHKRQQEQRMRENAEQLRNDPKKALSRPVSLAAIDALLSASRQKNLQQASSSITEALLCQQTTDNRRIAIAAAKEAVSRLGSDHNARERVATASEEAITYATSQLAFQLEHAQAASNEKKPELRRALPGENLQSLPTMLSAIDKWLAEDAPLLWNGSFNGELDMRARETLDRAQYAIPGKLDVVVTHWSSVHEQLFGTRPQLPIAPIDYIRSRR